MVTADLAGFFGDDLAAEPSTGIPLGCPVFDREGEKVGVVAGADDEALIVRHALIFEERAPFAAVARFDGEAIWLNQSRAELRAGGRPDPKAAEGKESIVVTMSNASGTPSIQECLVGVDFPIAKTDLLDRLQMNGATELLLEPIRNAPAERFTSPQEVIETIRSG